MNETIDNAIDFEYEAAQLILERADVEDIASVITWWTPDVINVSGPRTTALMTAIVEQYFEVVPLLLQQFDDAELKKQYIDLKSPYDGSTALSMAASYPKEEAGHVVQELLEAGADVHAHDDLGWGVLTKLALNASRPQLLTLAIDKGANVNEVSEPLKITPLMAAAARQDKAKDFVSLCIEKGADLNARALDGSTACDIARIYNNTEAIKPTRVCGITEHITDLAGWLRRTFNKAVQDMEYQAALAGGVLGSAAEDTGEDAELLMWAAAQADGETVEEVLRDEAEKENINATDIHGWTAVHYALHRHKTGGLEVLLSNGADPNITDGRKMSALSYAAIAAFPEGLRLLLEHGADPNAADCYGRTPLFYVLDMPDADMRHEALKLLLEHKADPAIKDSEDITPLSLAEAKADGSAEIIKTFNAGR